MTNSASNLPAISVIVLNWNGRHLLGDCLTSLRQQTFRDFEVIVVDNGSTDGSGVFVKDKFPEVRLVELDRNLGFATGNNRGVMVAQGEYVFFLNNDTESQPDMLAALHRAIQSDSLEVGAWTAKMLHWNDRAVIDNCGCGYSAFGTGFPIGSGEPDGIEFAQSTHVFGASGGAGCYRRYVLDEIGLFDDDFFYNNEDVDLSFRQQLAGYRCRYVPDAVVYHRGSATGGAASDRTIYHIHRNKEWVYFKNMPTPLLWKYLMPHLMYAAGWIVYWVFHGKARVILRAKLDAIRGWRSVASKRQQIQNCRRSNWRYIDSLIDKRRAFFIWRSQSMKSRLNFKQNRSRP